MLIRTHDRPIAWTLDTSSPAVRVEPITVALVQKHLRFGSSSESDLIGMYLATARTYFEEQASRQCIDAIWEYSLDAAPCQHRIELPRPPLVSVSSITYD